MLLSEAGRFYLVAVQQNKPLSIIAKMQEFGLDGKVREHCYDHYTTWANRIDCTALRSY